MIVGGNEVYPLTPPWDTVSLLGDQCPLKVPAGLAETERDVPPDAGAMSFHRETWAIGPQRLKRTESTASPRMIQQIPGRRYKDLQRLFISSKHRHGEDRLSGGRTACKRAETKLPSK
ncbi:unnamed protein product [Pleuronectes platessa]|uniref:Uncharacterized protein n=1 Tax=Pleuronectes platessa TaxID=8262 RepID=A0A9N7VW37_PLEPL|nr:unnamed protein product [Pleuronectes platessa]